MNTEFKKNLKRKRYGVKGIIAIGLPFLVAGLVMASGLNWTSTSVAKDFTSEAQVNTPAGPVMPRSFAELAENLSPTVVNVRAVSYTHLRAHET